MLAYPVWLRPPLSALLSLLPLHRCNLLFRSSPWRWEIKPESEGLSCFWMTPQGSCTVLSCLEHLSGFHDSQASPTRRHDSLQQSPEVALSPPRQKSCSGVVWLLSGLLGCGLFPFVAPRCAPSAWNSGWSSVDAS